jgi:hypothetical protein
MAQFVLSAYFNLEWIGSLCLCCTVHRCQQVIANVYGIVNTVVLTEGILVPPIEIHHKAQRDASIAILDNRQNSIRISDNSMVSRTPVGRKTN